MQNIEIDRAIELQITDSGPPVIRWEMLRNLMEYQDLSYPALAKASGTPESTLRKLLQGITKDPRISTMLPVVRALGASFDRLLGLAPARDFKREDATYDVTLMDNMRQNVEAMQIRLDEKREMIADLRKQVAAGEDECARLRRMYNEKCIALSGAEAKIQAMQAEVDEGVARRARRDKTENEQRTDIEELKKTLYRERDEHRKMRTLSIAVCVALFVSMAVTIYLLWDITHPAAGLIRY